MSVRYNNNVPEQNIQMGGIVIGENCRIGMNSSVSRGSIDDTIIMSNVSYGENNIGHNARPKNCVFTVRSTVCGSVIAENCWFGPHLISFKSSKGWKQYKASCQFSSLLQCIERGNLYWESC